MAENNKCYCGKSTFIYSGLFERNFCSDECIENLRIFFGTIEKVQQIVEKTTVCGEFKITGSTVTLLGDRTKGIIDKIDAQVQAQQADDKARKELKKLGLDDKTIEAMLQAKG